MPSVVFTVTDYSDNSAFDTSTVETLVTESLENAISYLNEQKQHVCRLLVLFWGHFKEFKKNSWVTKVFNIFKCVTSTNL